MGSLDPIVSLVSVHKGVSTTVDLRVLEGFPSLIKCTSKLCSRKRLQLVMPLLPPLPS
jgi:hypothetical protein